MLPGKKTPKFLKCEKTGRTFPYHAQLAKRNGMKPVEIVPTPKPAADEAQAEAPKVDRMAKAREARAAKHAAKKAEAPEAERQVDLEELLEVGE